MVSRGECMASRAPEPGLEEGHGLSCKEEEEEEGQHAPRSLWGLGWPLLFPPMAGLLSSARKGHYGQCQQLLPPMPPWHIPGWTVPIWPQITL